MGILDWFKNRPSLFEPDSPSDAIAVQAIDKAVMLTDPRIKLIASYRERLAPAVDVTVRYLREIVLAVPPGIRVSSAHWSTNAALRAFFASAQDIPAAIGRSGNLRTLLGKYSDLDDAVFVLSMKYDEQRALGVSLHGDMVQRDVVQTRVGFSNHEVRICGRDESEVRHLLGVQAYEYLLAQALSEIGEERSERRELEDNRALIKARLRMLQQQGPGLGSVFGRSPERSEDENKPRAQLEENERELEAIENQRPALDSELELLRAVLMRPERYIRFEAKRLRLNTMNVRVDEACTDVASAIHFSLVHLSGETQIERAFVLASFPRSELSDGGINFDDALLLL